MANNVPLPSAPRPAPRAPVHSGNLCSGCGREVSEIALACPQCGRLTGRGMALWNRLMHALGLGLVLGYIVAGALAIAAATWILPLLWSLATGVR